MEHKGTVLIDTNRLLLRQFTVNDIQHAFNNWTSDSRVTEFLRWPTHRDITVTESVLKDWIEKYRDKTFYQWAIVLKEIDEPIGTISVVDMDERTNKVHIGYCIGSTWWNKGYTSEAFSNIIPFLFNDVGVKRIESQHDPNNPNSGKVMKKCGLSFEGVLRKADWSNKGIVDASMYGLLAEDYNKANQQIPIYRRKTECAQFNDPYLILMSAVKNHYDCLIDENNDPVHDSEQLKEYMDKWDGQSFIDELELNNSKTVLEIGVGTGRLAIKTISNCKHFTGIDISEKTIERAKENLSQFENKTLICSDFFEYVFENQFDVIYSSLTFLHIREKLKAIREIAGFLTVNGRFVVSISKDQSKELDFGSRKVPLYPDNQEEIKSYLADADLQFIKQIETDFAWIIVAIKPTK